MTKTQQADRRGIQNFLIGVILRLKSDHSLLFSTLTSTFIDLVYASLKGGNNVGQQDLDFTKCKV